MNETSPRPTLFLIDGSSILYRAYYAFMKSPLTNRAGMETSAVFGFINMINLLFKQEAPAYVALATDRSRNTFRREIYPEYKAHRKETPQELRDQIPYALQVMEAMGVPVLGSDRYEADDILGTLARRLATPDLKVVIVTGDQDLLQMVDENVTVRILKKGIKETVDYTPERVESEFGVVPLKIIEIKGLSGDTSDNIPGVPKVGPKTALKLIQEYGDLETLFENLNGIKGALKDRLVEFKEQAFMSRDLGRIRTDVDVNVSLEDMRVGDPDSHRLKNLYLELDFSKLAADLNVPTHAVEVCYQRVMSTTALALMIEEIRGAEWISIDTETTSEFPVRAHLVGISISTRPNSGWYVPVGHHALDSLGQLSISEVLGAIGPALKDKKICGQNLKYDLIVLRRHGFELPSIDFDTMVASYLVDPSRRRHNLDDLALEFLNKSMVSFKDVVPKGKDFRDVSVETATFYASEDADAALQLKDVFSPQLKDQGVEDLFRNLEMPLVPILARMEMEGIRVDVGFLRQLGSEFGQEIRECEAKVFDLSGESFNLNSPAQLSRILFEVMKLPVLKKTKTGASTDHDVLLQLEVEHGAEIAGWLNRHRHLVKLKGTYVDSLIKLVHEDDGRVHTSWNQTVAATGRLSSSDPNLQNIPIRTREGVRIRRAFVAADGNLLMGFDYSQIELRIFAHLAGSPFLTQAFENGADVHRMTASRMFGIEELAVDASLRSRAKAINFGILYGMGAFGLSREVGIPQKEASQFISDYFSQFPEVKAFIERTKEDVRRDGYVSTLLGRRRAVPDILSKNGQRRAFAERIAVNTPIQGTAADLIKKAMIELSSRLDREIPTARLLLQIHDELIFEVAVGDADTLDHLVTDVMTHAIEMKVPVVVNSNRGNTWADLK